MKAGSRITTIVMAGAIAVAAAGCVGPSPAPGPSPATSASTPASGQTPTPAPTASATPTPTPTPDAEDVYDTTDMSTWLISYSGIGPVKLGRTVPNVLAEVGTGEQPCGPSVAAFFDSGVVAVGDGSDPSVVIAATTGVKPSVDPDARPHTDAGIVAGSSYDELLTAYPDAEPYTDTQGRPGYRLTDGTSFIFFTSVDGATINIIDVSTLPVDVKEYCG